MIVGIDDRHMRRARVYEFKCQIERSGLGSHNIIKVVESKPRTQTGRRCCHRLPCLRVARIIVDYQDLEIWTSELRQTLQGRDNQFGRLFVGGNVNRHKSSLGRKD